MSKVIPVPLLSLFTASQLQVCVTVLRTTAVPLTRNFVDLFPGNGLRFAGNTAQSAEVGGHVQRHRRNVIAGAVVLGGDGRIFESGTIALPAICLGSYAIAAHDCRLSWT